MHEDRVKMLRDIQALEFTAIELNLYLDTHPADRKALADYNTVTQQLHMLRKMYEQKYGPLMVTGVSPSQYPWRWVEDPWPWEIDY